MLIGYMRVSKADGSKCSTFNAMRLSLPVSSLMTSTMTRQRQQG